MSFGERLQALRREHDMTQEEFAQQLKVSRQAVSKWESSRGYPEIEKIIYICNRYGTSMGELFADEVPVAEPSKKPGGEAPLKSKSFKASLSSFYANLSPRNRNLSLIGILAVLAIILCLVGTHVLKGESYEMIMKFVWFGLLILFGIGEAVTVGLTSIWFAAGSLAALIATLLNAPLWLQIVLFIAVSGLCLLAIRPLAQKHLNDKVEPTNADRILGSQAMVTEPIDNLQAQGAVSIGGMTWSARSQSGDSIPAGTLVRVLRIEGVKVYVEPAVENESV